MSIVTYQEKSRITLGEFLHTLGKSHTLYWLLVESYVSIDIYITMLCM